MKRVILIVLVHLTGCASGPQLELYQQPYEHYYVMQDTRIQQHPVSYRNRIIIKDTDAYLVWEKDSIGLVPAGNSVIGIGRYGDLLLVVYGNDTGFVEGDFFSASYIWTSQYGPLDIQGGIADTLVVTLPASRDTEAWQSARAYVKQRNGPSLRHDTDTLIEAYPIFHEDSRAYRVERRSSGKMVTYTIICVHRSGDWLNMGRVAAKHDIQTLARLMMGGRRSKID